MYLKIILPAILSLLLFKANAQAEDIYGKRAGLVSYLTSIKCYAEAKMTSLADNPNYKSDNEKARNFNAEYQLIKLKVEKLINQFSADLYSSNRLKLYNSLNSYVKGDIKELPSRYSAYSVLIIDIDKAMEAFMINKFGGALGGASLGDVLGIAERIQSIAESARDFREKKIQSITGLLKDLKLAKLSDLVGDKDEKKDKEKK